MNIPSADEGCADKFLCCSQTQVSLCFYFHLKPLNYPFMEMNLNPKRPFLSDRAPDGKYFSMSLFSFCFFSFFYEKNLGSYKKFVSAM